MAFGDISSTQQQLRRSRLSLETLENRVVFNAADPLSQVLPVTGPVQTTESNTEQPSTTGHQPGCNCGECQRIAYASGNVAYGIPAIFNSVTPSPGSTTKAPPFPGQTFTLHSRPSATRKIFLDFDGHTTSGTWWNADENNNNNIVSTAFNFEGSNTTFSTNEEERIQNIWLRVAEDYSPFDVDVTTEDPGVAGLTYSGGSDTTWGMRAIITPDDAWIRDTAGGIGGIAYVPSFKTGTDTTCFIFSSNLGPNNEGYIAEAISHEVGHTLGLSHDGTNAQGAGSYYTGTSGSGTPSWGPIMGVAYDRTLSQFSKGEYNDANQFQDDLAIISNTTNNFSYRPDDAGNTIGTATPATISGTALSFSGVIERTTDVDVLSFTTGTGTVNFNFSGARISPNLDIRAELRDSAGTILTFDDRVSVLSASLSYNITAPGTYYLFIEGVGVGNAATTGYSDYASLGQYSVTGNVFTAPVLASLEGTALNYIENQAALNVTSTLTVTDDSTLNQATVTLNGYVSGQDSLQFTNSGGVTGNFNTTTGVLTFTGTALPSVYQTVLRSVKYFNSSDIPATSARSLDFQLRDTSSNFSNVVTRSITVTPVNDTPLLNSITDPAAILEEAGQQTINLAGILAGGGETQNLTVTATSSNQSLIKDANLLVTYTSPSTTGTLKYTIEPNVSGTAVITVRVTDDGGTANGAINFFERQFTVTVTPVNDAPSFAKGPDQYVVLNAGPQTVTNWASALSKGPPDESGQTLSFTVTNNANGLFSVQPAISPTGTLTFTPQNGAAGLATVVVKLQDNGGTANGGVDFQTQTFVINVAVNAPPTLDPITSPPAILEGAGEQTITVTGISPGIPAIEASQTITSVTATSGNTNLISSVSVTGTGSTRTLKYTPVADASGTAVITVRVTDNGGTASGGVDFFEQQFTVTVTPVNDIPTLDPISNPLDILEDAGLQSVAITGIFPGLPIDETSQTVTVTATSGNTNLIASVNVVGTGANRTLQYTPVANASGTALITVRVQDSGDTSNGGVNFIERQFTVSVLSVNDIPTLNTISDPGVILEEAGLQTIAISGISSGLPSNESSQGLTVSASSSNTNLISSVAVVGVGANRSLQYTPVSNASGTAIITVRVQDTGGTANGGVDFIERQFTVAVTPVNDIPTLNTIPTPNPILEDAGLQTISLVNVSPGLPADEAGQTVTVTATSDNLSLIASVAVVGNTLEYTPLADANGTAVIKVRVQDSGDTSNGGVNFIERLFTVNVLSVNDSPTLDSISDPSPILEDADVQSIAITGISPGLPANESSQFVTISATSSNTDLIDTLTIVGTGANRTLQYKPKKDANGSTEITVKVQDSGNTSNGGINLIERKFTVNVTPVNEPPILDNSGNPILDPVSKKSTNPKGTRVGDFADAVITDVDGGAVKGIAVIGADTAHGRWEFSLDAGKSWSFLSPVTEATARRLRSEDLVRFIPAANTNFTGSATLTFRAWDQTVGLPGDVVDLTDPSTDFSVSTAFESATIRIAGVFAEVNEDTKSSGTSLSQLPGNTLTDADDPLLKKSGIAVIGSGGNIAGRWEYFSGGWKRFFAFDATHATLLKSTDKVRFIPDANQVGEAYLIYRAWDQSIGKAGSIVDLSGPGFTGANSPLSDGTDALFIHVNPVNDKPILDIATTSILTPIAPGDKNSAGDAVADILGATVTDPDLVNVLGLAVTDFSKKGGVWKFKHGTNDWAIIPAVTGAKPLLLDPTDRVRFEPEVSFTGTATISYVAWDGTAGTAGDTFATAKMTAFSTAVEKATLLVTNTPIPFTNSAPVLDTAPVVTFTAFDEDTKPVERMVGSLLDTASSDIDANPLKGIAVSGFTGASNGIWQYSTNGKLWKVLPVVSEESAFLLKQTDYLRYLPNLNFNGSASISYHAWDQTRGTAGQYANLALPGNTGGSSPFSLAVETATVTINPVNDAPVLNTKPKPTFTTVPVDSKNPAGDLVSNLLGNALTDVDTGSLKGIAITKAPTGKGLWEYQLQSTGPWIIITGVDAKNAFYLRDVDRIRFKPSSGFKGTETLTYAGWDQTIGTAGSLGLIKDNRSISKLTETATVIVSNENTRPVLDITPELILPPVMSGNQDPAGFQASILLRGVSDADANALLGIAVFSTDISHGQWQYQIDGGGWQNMQSGTVNSAFLLKATDLIRFIPEASYVGTTSLKFKAWDRTGGSVGSSSPTTSDAFSKETETATLAVNKSPKLTWL